MVTRFEQFTFIISKIYREIQKIERDEMIKQGYRGAFAIYLASLKRYDEGLTCAELCELCDKDKAAVSRIIAEMEEKGLVKRLKTTEKGYRAKITLTARGTEVAEFVSERALAAVNAVSGELMTDAQREIFYSTLDTLYKNLRKVSKEGSPQE